MRGDRLVFLFMNGITLASFQVVGDILEPKID